MSDLYKVAIAQEAEIERLTRERDEAVALLKEALRCMKEAKLRWAPTTTNSDADVCIARIDALLARLKG